MKSKSCIKYFIYLIIIISLYSIGTILLRKYNNDFEKTFISNYWLVTLIKLVFFGGIGIILGVDSFLTELNRKGKWKLNIPKLIILGIPSFIFSIPYIVLTLIPLSTSFNNIFTVSSIILGYTLISSLYK